MCHTCTMAVCPDGCPQKRGGRTPLCSLCNEPLYPDEGNYTNGAVSICRACTDCLTADDLITLSQLESMGELLHLLGFYAT